MSKIEVKISKFDNCTAGSVRFQASLGCLGHVAERQARVSTLMPGTSPYSYFPEHELILIKVLQAMLFIFLRIQ